MNGAGEAALEVRELSVSYSTDVGPLAAVRGVSLTIAPGQIYGLVGESGSGKTTLARAIVRYLPAGGRITAGSVRLDGTDLLALPAAELRHVWGARVTMVHQDPNSAVNPSIPIGEQIAETVRAHLGLSRRRAREATLDMLAKVRLADPAAAARRYAHQLSGGQLQRVLIAIALCTNPRLLIMDEPTTALDVTTEAAILDLVRELLAEYRTAVLYITHNLGVVARLSQRVGVMYAGELVEEGEVRDVFQRALHPYTLGLLACLPRVEADKREVLLASIPGLFPRPGRLPAGCIFAPRCPGAQDACRAARPPLVAAEAGHRTACRRWPDLRRAPREFVAAPARPAAAEAAEPPGTAEAPEPPIVLEAVGLRKYFPAGPRGPLGLLRGARPVVRAVDDISVRVRQGLTMGIVGESGCGKTTLARCIAALEEASAGKMELEGEELPRRLARRSPAQLKRLQMVFQNPDASLNPQLPVEASLARPLALRARLPRAAVRERVRELLRAVQLPEDYARRLPHELSGGEKQRVAIARSLATEPALMICDEPLSSLDVSVQASLMNLLADLQDSRGTSYLFISHDLSAVRYLSDWIAVIYLGRLWEIGSAAEVFSPPHHPYTEALLSAMPVPDPDARRRDIRLGGGASSAVQLPTGCRFHPRCPRKLGKICETLEPPWQVHGQWHRIRCHIPPGELLRLQKKEGS